MKLHANFGPVIAGLLVVGALGLTHDLGDPAALPPAPTPVAETPSDLAFRGAEGYGKNALDFCRDSAYYGGDMTHGNADDWPVVVHIVDPDTYDDYSDVDGGIQAILRDSVADKQLDFVLVVQSGMVDVIDSDGGFDRYTVEITNDCVYMTSILAQGDGPPVFRAPFTDRNVKFRISSGTDQDSGIVVRDSRFWSDSGGSGGQTPAFAVRHVNDYVIDHFEQILGEDQSSTRPTDDGYWQGDGTVQYSILTQTNTWPSGGTCHLVSFKIDGQGDSLTRLTYLRNYFPCGVYRGPKASVSTTDSDTADRADFWEFINNASHGFGNMPRIAGIQGAFHGDWIGNYIGYGRNEAIGNGFQPIEYRRCDSQHGSGTGLEWGASSLFASGNKFYDASGYEGSDLDIIFTPDDAPHEFNCDRGPDNYPDSLTRAQRLQHPDTVTAWDAAAVLDSLISSGSLFVQAGPRGVTCGGTLRDVRNDVVQKLMDYATNRTYLGAAYDDSMDAGWGWLGRDSLVAATQCADSDADGLTDAFESWTGISDPDSMIGGFFAIEHLLNGDSAYLADILAGGGGGGDDPTYGTNPARYVYIADLLGPDTSFSNPDGSGEPQDTLVIPLYADPDTVPLNTPHAIVVLDDSATALIVTTEDLAASPRDSAWVDSTLSANTTLCSTRGVCDPADLRDILIPGDL